MDNERQIKTEMANAFSHGIGILLTLAFSPLLIAKALNSGLGWGVAFYCFTLLLMFSTSTLYHAITQPMIKHAMRVIDHIGIFFLIGGSYIPFVLKFSTENTRFWFFVIQWGFISLGILKKLFYTGHFRALSSLIYIFIGAIIFFIDPSFISKIPEKAAFFVILGGLSYLVGVVFYQFQKIPYNHFIWHLFVLIASFSHFYAVYLIL